ncbi:MAG: glycosyltransferase family 2 protein [Solirubrobacterales bacterium]|nr:glycosyltransferase family 2 protein [Solirubrobacterales bacterium]
MDSGRKSVAIVPALNEEAAVGGLISEIHEKAPGYDVLVVDDGSSDGTAAVARAAGAIVLSHPFNLGIGGAVQSGYRFAFLQGYDVAVQVDGDGQHDPSQLASLETALNDGEADMVWGSRFLEGAGYPVGSMRRVGQKLFAGLVSLITREAVTDPTSGFRMTNRRGIELFARDYPHDFPEVEAILMVHAHDMSLHEVPVTMRPRQHGNSSLAGYSAPYYMVRVLLAIFVGLFRRRPVPLPGDDWLATPPSKALEGTLP